MRAFIRLSGAFVLCAVVALLTAGCSNSSTAATSTTTPSTSVTENIGGALTVGGLSSHAFTTFSGGTISVTLSGLSGPTTVVGLGLGVYNATTFVCSLTTSLNTTPGTAAQISATVDTGTYCVEIYDIGTLGGPQGFSISIVHP